MEKKFNIIICMLVSAITSLIISLCMLFLSNNVIVSSTKLSDFNVEHFNMDTEKTISDYITYEGNGTISCKDTKNDYILLIEVINKTTGEVYTTSCFIHNGEGKISTYDSSLSGATEKPEYEFNIIGFNIFNK